MTVATVIGPGVVEIDTLLGGWARVTAGYLIQGPAPVLIETGSQSSVPALLDALQALGIGPADLAGVAVTHIHLDHAGGVGDAARRPTGIALAHYGLLGSPDELLAEAEDELRKWADTAEEAWRAGQDIAEALSARFGGSFAHLPAEQRARMETLNGIHSNAAGLLRWLETTKGDGSGG